MRGDIVHPKDEQIFYLPRGTPYLPRGTLREVLAYPLKVEDFEAAAFAHALRRLGLERLEPMLDVTHRWDRELSQDEQVSLAFARIVLQKPPWVLVDDTFGVARRRDARAGHGRGSPTSSSAPVSSTSAGRRSRAIRSSHRCCIW